MKKILLITIMLAILTSSIAYGSDYSRVQNLGLIGQGAGNWENKITRAELATIAVRLVGMENQLYLYQDNIYKDVSGWAKPYINAASFIGLMKGTSKDTFNPQANISYVEVLTVIMRALDYKDKIDFTEFPDEYYQKAIEIGLANIYIGPDEIVTRATVADTIEKSLDLKLKDSNLTLLSKISNNSHTNIPIANLEKQEKIEEQVQGKVEEKDITIENITFNTNISALFKGKLKGTDDFTGYKIILSSKSESFTEQTSPSKNGEFSMTDFPIDIVTRLSGYQVKVVNREGGVVYEEQTQQK